MAKVISFEKELALWKQLEDLQDVFPYTEEGFLDFANYVANKLIKGSPDLIRTQFDLCKYLFNNNSKIAHKNKAKPSLKETRKLRRKQENWSKKRLKKWAEKKAKKSTEKTSDRLPGSRLRMIQANRGLGKTTFAAIYSVFRLIHDPTTRVLIFSAGGKLSKEIANWVIQIMEGLEILHFMLPDKANGDRSSMESYDILWVFRGAEKSPSVKCLGVDSNAQGSRADVILADDIESMKNSRTVMMKEILIELTKEFESICQVGDIIYLGTPQFFDSIYNLLPSRGFDVRIWTARYPTAIDLEAYEGFLSPMLMDDIKKHPDWQTGYGLLGDQGKPTGPKMFPDKLLIEKETSQGPSKFQLQYMLNTRMSDASRYPLKLNNLVIQPFTEEKGIISPQWCNDERARLHFSLFSRQVTDRLYSPMAMDYETQEFERSLMYIDPAGGGKNADETAFAIIRLLGNRIYLQAWGGVAGGFEEEKMRKLVSLAKMHNIREVWFEKNFGNGAFKTMIEPYFQQTWDVNLEEHWATGQKELRIIDTLEPFIASHRFIIHPDVVRQDLISVEQYPDEVKKSYSGLFQMSMITRDKGCLVHDDRLDALAGAVHQITQQIAFDEVKVMSKRREDRQQDWMQKIRNPRLHREDVSINRSPVLGLGNSFSGRL